MRFALLAAFSRQFNSYVYAIEHTLYVTKTEQDMSAARSTILIKWAKCRRKHLNLFVLLSIVLYAEGISKGAVIMGVSKETSFRITVSVATLAIFGALVVIGLSYFQQRQGLKSATKQPPTFNLATAQLVATTTSWNTYNDTGYPTASGISLKYPPNWEIRIGRQKFVGNTTNPVEVVYQRTIYLPSTETPQDEWNTCASQVSVDACGAYPGDKTVSSGQSTVNGFAVYTATIQNSIGTYQVAVIRGNKVTSDGVAFDEFMTAASDTTATNTFATSIASTTFPN